MEYEDAVYLQLLEQDIDDEEIEEEDRYNTLAGIAIIVAGAEIARLNRVEQRNMSRTYLCRPQLLPNPRQDTPWQRLYRSQNDRAFMTTMGIDVATFDHLITSGFGLRWYLTPVPRDDASSMGTPRPAARSLDAWGALGLVLHYLTSTMREISLQEIFALIPTTVSRYITFSLSILLQTLREIPDASIRWPKGRSQFQENSDLIVARHPRLGGAFASIDGLNLPVQTSADIEIENATYNGWKSDHFVSSVLVFSPQGLIIAANINAPGSWHDSRVARPIYEKLRERTPDGFYLVADTAFPRGSQDIEDRIQAPLKTGQQFEGTAVQIEERMAYNQELLSYRQTAEWGNRGLQGTFGRLRIPLEVNHSSRRQELLETCLRLNNLRTNRVGANQIRTVYLRNSGGRQIEGDDDMFLAFETMLFSEQRVNDRVHRFHTYVEYDDNDM